MSDKDIVRTIYKALLECQELLDNSDVRYFISNELGEQAKLHRALNNTAKALTLAREQII